MPGGSRKPAVHPELAAWRVVEAGLSGTGQHVVGECAGCGQPLVGDGTPVGWTFTLPGGEAIVVDAAGRVEGGLTEVGRRIRQAYPTGFQLSEIRPGLALFQGWALTMMLGPVLLWVLAIVSVVVFLLHFGRPVAFP